MRDAQADVPLAKGLGRNLRSKTRWFTGFCNSHQVSHFATFFIDARAEISVAESRLQCLIHGITPIRRLTDRMDKSTDRVYVP